MSFAQFVERRLFQPAESKHSVGMIYYKIHHNDHHTPHSTHLYMSKEDACATKGNLCIDNNKYKKIGFKLKLHHVQTLYFVPNLKDLNNTWNITTGRLVKIKYGGIEYKKNQLEYIQGSGNLISYFAPK